MSVFREVPAVMIVTDDQPKLYLRRHGDGFIKLWTGSPMLPMSVIVAPEDLVEALNMVAEDRA